jgi:hypothetical protein
VPYLNPDAEIQPRSEDEPVTFSFGGAIIEMKDDTKPENAAQGSGGGMSSAQTAILSFVLFAAVLGLALYFVSR